MKHLLILIWMTIAIVVNSLAQVGINSDGSQPNSSAMLDVKSNTRGFLPPRMNHQEMVAIVNPGDGLVVFCSDCGTNGLGALSIFMSGQWYTLSANCLLPSLPTVGTHEPSANQIVWHWNPVTDAVGYKWFTNGCYSCATDVGTSTSYTETGLNCNQNYTRYLWAYNSCGNSAYVQLTQTTSLNPASPASGSHQTSPTQITWNWNAVPGATGYKWGTTNVYANATDMGTATTKTETGLTCFTAYTRYVWAYNGCNGLSAAVPLTQSTTKSPAAPVEATLVTTSAEIVWNWTPSTGATGYRWGTTTNYANATDMGTSTSKTESGLACNTLYTRYIWAYSLCGISPMTTITGSTLADPQPPASGIHIASVNQIVWKWAQVPGATGYKWSTTNNYATALNLGNVIQRIESGLTCNTPYSRFVWAYNSCGNSIAATLTDTTSMSGIPASPVAGTHTATTSQVTWNWEVVSGATGYKWNTTNDYFTAIDMGLATSKTESGLTCATPYSRYVWAYTTCGVSPVTILSKSTIFCIWICGMPLTDNRDGKIYGTQLIGSQCWMDQNLNVGVEPGFNVPQTNNGIIEKYCRLNLASNCTLYGGLYSWDEMMNYTVPSNATPSGRQGICPTGWHIPSDGEWCQMESYLDATVVCIPDGWIGTDVGGKLKESGTASWSAPNTGGTNSSGFNAIPSSYTWSNGTGAGAPNVEAYFHTASEYSATAIYTHKLMHDSQQVIKLALLKSTNYGLSVRCVKD